MQVVLREVSDAHVLDLRRLIPAQVGDGLGVAAVAGSVAFWATARATRWYLQRLYGQHLDRLESHLRELEAPEAPGAP